MTKRLKTWGIEPSRAIVFASIVSCFSPCGSPHRSTPVSDEDAADQCPSAFGALGGACTAPHTPPLECSYDTLIHYCDDPTTVVDIVIDCACVSADTGTYTWQCSAGCVFCVDEPTCELNAPIPQRVLCSDAILKGAGISTLCVIDMPDASDAAIDASMKADAPDGE